jgi:hypothetical protein
LLLRQQLLLLLESSQQQGGEEVVLDGQRLSVLVVDHELGEHLRDLLGDKPELERGVGILSGVLPVAEGDGPQLEQAVGKRAEVLDVLLDAARGARGAELPGAVDEHGDGVGVGGGGDADAVDERAVLLGRAGTGRRATDADGVRFACHAICAGAHEDVVVAGVARTPAKYPIAVLRSPVVLRKSAWVPLAVLLRPVVFEWSAR